MSDEIDIKNSATVVISHHVKPGFESEYELWLEEIVPIAKSYTGHLGVSIIHPVVGASVTYTVIIRFDKKDHLLVWMNSAARKQLIEKVKPYLAEDDAFLVKTGLDFWFTPEGAKAKLPTRWKQFLVTWSAIFPLVLAISYLLQYVAASFNITGYHAIKILTLTFIVVMMMVYVVMPRYTKLVHKWLFS